MQRPRWLAVLMTLDMTKGVTAEISRFALAATIAVAVGSAAMLSPVSAQDIAPAGPTAVAPKDGTWIGPRVFTFYGYLQVEAVVAGGVLTKVRIREYPKNDGTSRRINAIAVPYLEKSAVSAGSAQVDTITGATITSKAFIKSLGEALDAAAR